MLTEQDIRRIVHDEINRNKDSSRFNLNSIPNHTHNGIDSLSVQAGNILPNASIIGNVEFAHATTYTLNLNSSFTPQRIYINGTVTGNYGVGVGVRGTFSGVAQLTPTLYFQPNTSTSVVTGNIQYPFNGKPAQCSSFMVAFRDAYDFGGSIGVIQNPVFAGSSEDHIASIYMPTSADSNIQARATITNFSRTSITVDIPILSAGWELFINFVVT